MMLTAISTPKDLYSPLYPEYLSSQDYTWIIQAEQRRQLVTLEVGVGLCLSWYYWSRVDTCSDDLIGMLITF